jgi:hypothetical protein
MADFSFTPAATGIKPVQGMSLGEMMNTARGAQQYQQSAQLMPIELQRAQAEANVAQQTQDPRISSAKSLATQAEIQAKTAQVENFKAQYGLDSQQSSDMGKIFGGFAYDSRLSPEALTEEPFNGVKVMHDIIKEGRNQGIPDEKLSIITAPGMFKATTDPKGFVGYLQNMQTKGMAPSEQRAAGLEKLTPTESGQVFRQTPQIYGKKPQVTLEVPTNIQSAPVQGAPVQDMPQGAAQALPLPYPVRSASVPFRPEPAEAADLAAGTFYRNNLVSRQPLLATDKRNVEETIKQAQKINDKLYEFERQGGGLADIARKGRNLVATDEYKLLSKDLANLQISNLRALGQGGNTVAGMDLTRVASGTDDVPPKVLINIARRAQADMTNIDMQANGAEKFKNRFGDNNMKAYQQAWSKNADSKIFEAMNIAKDVKDPDKRKIALDALFPTPEEHKDFLEKYKNLKKLSETGSL